MLISPALAGHGVTDTGGSGGGIALLIILAVVIVFVLVLVGQKKWRSRKSRRDGSGSQRLKHLRGNGSSQ